MKVIEIYTPIFLQKAEKYKPDKHKKLLAGRFIQEKLDGVGAQIVINRPDIQIYAMSKAAVSGEFSNFTKSLPHIIEELRLSSLQDGIYQGELITTTVPTGSDRVGFISGILHADDSIERQKDYKIKLVLYEVPSSKEPYYKRYEYLNQVFNINEFPYLLKYVSVNPILGINDINNITLEQKFQEIIDKNGEGLVLYDKDCLYKHSEKTCQRNKGLLKIKIADEKEVLCIKKIRGVANGKFANTLGALRVIDSSGKEFNVGSFKLSNKERDYIWNNVEVPFIGEIVYFKMTNKSCKIARFIRYRPDKDIDTWNKE